MADQVEQFYPLYLKAKDLLEKSHRSSTATANEYKRKALGIFRQLDVTLTVILDENDHQDLSVILSLSNFELGVLAHDVDDPAMCESYLRKSWDLIRDFTLKPTVIILAMSILNQYGILWSGKNELERAKEYLRQAEMLYESYKRREEAYPLDICDLFPNEANKKEKSWMPLEKALTNTMYYLAQVYEHLNDNENATKYCHITLKRQLDDKDYEPLVWSLTCATLSQYFVANGKFKAARYILSCANYMVNDYDIKLKLEIENVDDGKREQLNRCKADIARCWVKYVLQLLMVSCEKQLDLSDDDGDGSNPLKYCADESEAFLVTYKLLDESDVTELESQVTHRRVSTFEEAKLLFLFGLECVNKSKKFYTMQNHTSDSVILHQDNSNLYKFLSIFEESLNRKCKMHRRRINMLEDVLKQLNPEQYLTFCRQLTFELAETYNEMVAIKLQIANMTVVGEGVEDEDEDDGDSQPEHIVKKINFLACKGIEYYTSFVDSLRNGRNKLPNPLPENLVRAALLAFFSIGRMYSKIVVNNATQEVINLKKVEIHYKYVVKYVEKYPQYESDLLEELAIMKDMLELIPGKLAFIEGTMDFVQANNMP